MSTSATLDSDTIALDPGGTAVIPLQIRNNGEIVEGYTIEVVGPPAAWATVEPATVSIYPGSAATATVAFRPPRSAAVPAGDIPFGVRVIPTDHPEDAVVPEGVVQILPFLDTTAEVTPRTSRGTRGAKHQVAIDNRGNLPQTLLLTGTDAGEQLRMVFRPEVMTVGPGHAEFGELRVRPVRRIWRGAPVTHQFQVVVTPQDAPPVTLEASHLQQQVIPSWLPKALVALLLLALALAGIWFGLLRPTVREAARDAVRPQVAQVERQAAAAEEASKVAGEAAQEANSAQTDAVQSADRAAVLVGEPRTSAVPFSTRLTVAADPGQTSPAVYEVPEGKIFSLTDIVLQNPQGDFGRATLQLGDQVLFSMALENFRDNDYHFVSPIVAAAGDELQLVVRCNAVGEPPDQDPAPTACDTSAYLGGTLTDAPAATPTPTPSPGATTP